MSLRFSNSGPEFPTELVDDLLNGDVVFLCGAGVSTPQLPGFAGLVSDVYSRLGVAQSEGEAAAIQEWRYEEALGALARRLANKSEMHRTVRDILSISDPEISNHKTLLRLSRGLDNQVCIVTTNFDTFFERALLDAEGSEVAKSQSLAGQSLPPPGSEGFGGIIHLHGRLRDEALNLDDTPLVLTSAEYGEAYMRSGWASRFLFELVRCKTIVLVGYRAGDSPVRYFLNVLESDRDRFADIKRVYALDAYDGQSRQALAKWDSIAVRPIGYQRGPTTLENRHESLWRDLATLADLVERPKSWRRSAATRTFSKPFDDLSASELALAAWLLAGKRDLWDLIINKVVDSRWFTHFSAQKLWSPDDAAWVLAAWCAKGWSEKTRLDTAIHWSEKLPASFGGALLQRLESQPPTEEVLRRAWRLIASATPSPSGYEFGPYQLASRLRKGGAPDSDLRAAVRLLRPDVKVGSRYEDGSASPPFPKAARLRDALSLGLHLRNLGSVRDVLDALSNAEVQSNRLLEIATSELRAVVAEATEAELIGDLWDQVNESVPSAEAHAQNEYRDGAVYLSELLTNLLPKVAAIDRNKARVWAENWKDIPSVLGQRLWLVALRFANLYDADTVAQAILELPMSAFWSIRRELILTMQERLKEASPRLVEMICERIIAEAPTLFSELGADNSHSDWRPQVRDRDAWLRLTALKVAGALPLIGHEALARISARHPFFEGDYDESDLFSSYMTGVRSIAGNPARILEADPERRLEEASKRSEEWDPDSHYDWSAYCSVDPRGALQALTRQQAVNRADIGLWSDLIGSLAWPRQVESEEVRAARTASSLEALNVLDRAAPEILSSLGGRLVELLPTARSAGLGNADEWWDRLWRIAELEEVESEEISERFYDRVINRPAGKLAEQLIQVISDRKKKSKRISPDDRERLRLIFSSDTPAGWLARGVCTRQAAFLLFMDRQGTISKLRPWIGGDGPQGATLRSVLVEMSELGSAASRVFKKEIIRGVIESNTMSYGTHVASRLIRPLIGHFFSKGKIDWGFLPEDVRPLLKVVSPSILEGAAKVLRDWVRPNDIKPEAAWRRAVKPIFLSVWPREGEFKRASLTADLAAVCVRAGREFPDAFATLRHYLVPYDGDWIGLHFLEGSTTPEQYPALVLEFLWTIAGPGCVAQSVEMAKVLDRIAVAQPNLEFDRRYQWLEQRATRF